MKNGAWNCAAAFRQKSVLLSSVWKCPNSTLHTASPAMRRRIKASQRICYYLYFLKNLSFGD